MKKVLLVNTNKVPHYRVPVYNYLYTYLHQYQYDMTVISEGVQEGNPHPVSFPRQSHRLNFRYLLSLLTHDKPDAIVFWLNFELYKFPILALAKILRIKIIYWGHGRDLEDLNNLIKNAAYSLEHWMDDAIILYAEHLKSYLPRSYVDKTFVANNTLNMTVFKSDRMDRGEVKKRYGITTAKNIICMGRMQRRKRIGDLVKAFRLLELDNVGLILAGPDDEGLLKGIKDRNIYLVGPVYGEESLDLLAAADVFCLPGHVGLSIVDAFFCGLPMVTERVHHAPEIMYLKEGENGYIVPIGDVNELAQKLSLLLKDDHQRERFSRAARAEIMANGHIDRLCEGFRKALDYVLG